MSKVTANGLFGGEPDISRNKGQKSKTFVTQVAMSSHLVPEDLFHLGAEFTNCTTMTWGAVLNRVIQPTRGRGLAGRIAGHDTFFGNMIG